MTELRVSIACYNEIANALEAQGKKVERGAIITLEKDDKIINPIDWRLVTLRRDTADIAAKVYNDNTKTLVYNDNTKTFVEFSKEFYEYVLTGNISNSAKTQTNEW